MAETGKRVLIVDDMAINVDHIGSILREDYRVSVAISGEQALEKVGEPPLPDVILLDLLMPGMNGTEVAKKLYAEPATRGIPIIVVSAMSENVELDPELEALCFASLQKPVDRQELLDMVSRALDTDVHPGS